MTTHEAQDRLAELRRQRGAAKVDGRKYDAVAIQALENEIAAMEDAGAELARRDRAASAEELAAFRDKLGKDLNELNTQCLAAIAEAEAGCKQLAAAIDKAIALNSAMAVTATKLMGNCPMALNPMEFVNRLSGRMAATMAAGVRGYPHKFGPVEWRGAGLYNASKDGWAEREAQLRLKHLPITLKQGD